MVLVVLLFVAGGHGRSPRLHLPAPGAFAVVDGVVVSMVLMVKLFVACCCWWCWCLLLEAMADRLDSIYLHPVRLLLLAVMVL